MSQPNLVLLHVHLQASNTIRHGSCTDRQYGLLARRIPYVPLSRDSPSLKACPGQSTKQSRLGIELAIIHNM